MDIRLIKLKIRNFKGIKSFFLSSPKGKSLNIYGDNETGKSTVMNAFYWCLFGKDSNEKQDFNIKFIYEDGKVETKKEHEVEVTFLVDGEKKKFKRIYKENWVKKRGQVTATFTGHTTDYFVDDIPVKKGEYEQAINQLCKENLFKLITNPRYFSALIDWKKRRQLIMQLVSDITLGDIIKANPDIEPIKEELQKHTAAELKKKYQVNQKKINESLKILPARIDENNKNIEDLKSQLPKTGDYNSKSLREELKDIQRRYKEIRNNKEINELKDKIKQLEHELEKAEGISKVDLVMEKSRKENISKYLQETLDEIEEMQAKIKQLRDEYIEVNKSNFNCPTCNQPYPEDKQEQIKKERLAQITQEGKKLKDKLVKSKDKIKELESELEESTKKIAEYEKQIAEIDEDKIKKEIEQIQKDIDVREFALQEELKGLENRENFIHDKFEEINKVEVIRNEINSLQKRNEELVREIEKLSEEYEYNEMKLYLIDEYVKTRINLISEDINSKFEKVRFKLFDIQVNGGVKEVCEVTYKGTPYYDLNDAGKIQAALDVIKTFQRENNIFAPVWIDNRESVIRIPEMDCQVINLIVTEGQDKLKIEEV